MISEDHIKIAIQEDMLPGPKLADRFHQAADLGLQGIEFWSKTLPEQVSEIERMNGTQGVVAASVNHGQRSRFLDPDPSERNRAISELEEALVLAGRIGAAGVIFVPHFFGPLLPDLSPWKDSISLERELLAAQLNILTQAAEQADTGLWVEPVNRYETHFLNHLDQATSLVAPLAHPRLGIVADLFHLSMEETDIPAVIHKNGALITHVHLADSNRMLPGKGSTDFVGFFQALRSVKYSGWLTLECDDPGNNLVHAQEYGIGLRDSLDYVRDCFLASHPKSSPGN